MVHALQEAQRVLKPNGVLVDLRPAAVHRRVGLLRGGRYRPVGAMRERFDDDRAANRAVAYSLRAGLFREEGRLRFECRRVLDTAGEFRVWLDEFVQQGNLPAHDWLSQAVDTALQGEPGEAKIVVKGPLVLRVLRKPVAVGAARA